MGGMALLHTEAVHGANHGMDGLITMTGTALASLARARAMIPGPTEVDGLKTMTGTAPPENPARVPTTLGPMEMMVGLPLAAGTVLLASLARAPMTGLLPTAEIGLTMTGTALASPARAPRGAMTGQTEAAGLKTMTGTAPLASPARALRGAMTGQTVDGIKAGAMVDGVDGAGVERVASPRAVSPRAVSPRAARVDTTGAGVDGIKVGAMEDGHGAGVERAAREDTGRGEDGPPGDHTILSGETVDGIKVGVAGTTVDGMDGPTMTGILLESQARAPGLLPTAEIGLMMTGTALASLARALAIGMAVVTHGSTLRTTTG